MIVFLWQAGFTFAFIALREGVEGHLQLVHPHRGQVRVDPLPYIVNCTLGVSNKHEPSRVPL
jgi:hypothetical protein